MKKIAKRLSVGLFLLGCLNLPGMFGHGDQAAESFAELMHESMARMDGGLEGVAMTGNADHDFAAMMIPHHQGAIDMAKAELLHGKDQAMRRLAQQIIVDQQSEIELMKLWSLKHPAGAAAGDVKP